MGRGPRLLMGALRIAIRDGLLGSAYELGDMDLTLQEADIASNAPRRSPELEKCSGLDPEPDQSRRPYGASSKRNTIYPRPLFHRMIVRVMS
jgi:hypothetical protein